MKTLTRVLLAAAIAVGALQGRALEPIPDKLVVLTFDDSVASQFTVVRPLLKEFGFGATFFISEGFGFATNKTDYMTWEQIAQLHRDGFEIGNHSRDHMGVEKKNVPRLREQIEVVNKHFEEHGIPRAQSFSWPGNALTPEALPILSELGIRFARRGGAPEFPYEEGRGFAFEPGKDHPLLIPSAGDSRPKWTLADFQRAVNQAKDGRIAVLQFHGVPDRDHPWVNTPPELFREYLKFLHEGNFKVIALRDLARYVDPQNKPAEPMAIINSRKATMPNQ
jgi:peptidoglycan/xylan/chitin deacetylase (PgdA/CDA1 family)